MLGGNKSELYFWRNTEGSEVDLIIRGTGILKAYEIKWAKQGTTASTKSFSNTYNIAVEVITKDTFFNLLG